MGISINVHTNAGGNHWQQIGEYYHMVMFPNHIMCCIFSCYARRLTHSYAGMVTASESATMQGLGITSVHAAGATVGEGDIDDEDDRSFLQAVHSPKPPMLALPAPPRHSRQQQETAVQTLPVSLSSLSPEASVTQVRFALTALPIWPFVLSVALVHRGARGRMALMVASLPGSHD